MDNQFHDVTLVTTQWIRVFFFFHYYKWVWLMGESLFFYVTLQNRDEGSPFFLRPCRWNHLVFIVSTTPIFFLLISIPSLPSIIFKKKARAITSLTRAAFHFWSNVATDMRGPGPAPNKKLLDSSIKKIVWKHFAVL